MKPADPASFTAPIVSVVMANFEAGDKIVHALRSVLRQTLADIEVIVSDDASRDGSVDHVRAMMAQDGRIRLVVAEHNGGPARCRNRALDLARGRWIAIVDSDDIIHPERLERLLAAAAQQGADIIADDLLLFYEDGTPPRLHLGDATGTSFAVSPERWVLAGVDGSPALGYLKPMISAARLNALRYDEKLRIGEDHDLVLRLLLDGARMMVVPEPFYLYRRHSASISHRLSVEDVSAIIERQAALVAEEGAVPSALSAAFAARLRSLRRGLAYERLVAGIKERRLLEAAALVARDPAHLGRLWRSFSEGRRRRQVSRRVEPSPVLTLGAGGASGVSAMVPDYVPVDATDWAAPRPRRIWRELAGLRGIGAVRWIALDRAGQYAAGFIPEAEPLHLEAGEGCAP